MTPGIPLPGRDPSVPTIHDITCPSCGAVEPVIKTGIDTYRCTDCEETFSATDVR